jgi:hypothetical protein
VVILVTPNNENDARLHFISSGGCPKFLKSTIPTKDLLLTMIEMLHGCRKVEDIFKDIRINGLVSSKYPYLPVFESIQIPAIKSTDDGDEDETQTTTSSQKINNYQVDEIEEASENTLLVPDIVSKSPQRRAQMEKDENLRQQKAAERAETTRLKEEAEREQLRKWREGRFQEMEKQENNNQLTTVKEEDEIKKDGFMFESKGSLK